MSTEIHIELRKSPIPAMPMHGFLTVRVESDTGYAAMMQKMFAKCPGCIVVSYDRNEA